MISACAHRRSNAVRCAAIDEVVERIARAPSATPRSGARRRRALPARPTDRRRRRAATATPAATREIAAQMFEKFAKTATDIGLFRRRNIAMARDADISGTTAESATDEFIPAPCVRAGRARAIPRSIERRSMILDRRIGFAVRTVRGRSFALHPLFLFFFFFVGRCCRIRRSGFRVDCST